MLQAEDGSTVINVFVERVGKSKGQLKRKAVKSVPTVRSFCQSLHTVVIDVRSELEMYYRHPSLWVTLLLLSPIT